MVAVSAAAITRAREHLGLGDDADTGELALALGCDAGDPGALRVFDSDYLQPVRPLLGRQGAAPEVIDEVLQRLREDLLLRRPDEPYIRLVGYAGSGRLGALVRVSASRMLVYLRRYVLPGSSTIKASIDASRADGLLRELWSQSEPETSLVSGSERQLFKACFGQAAGALDAGERALLRFYFVEELSYQQIAELYGLNKSTVCRQLAAIHRKLLAGITRAWSERTGQADSVELGTLLDGELDLSISRLLRG